MAKGEPAAGYGLPSFGILGPVEAWDGEGRPLRITRGQQRLLVALIESANQVVRDDVLLEKLWPDDEREQAVRNLHTHVWSLRRTLSLAADGPPPSLARREGYELRLDDARLDWARHRRLRAGAARALAGGRLEQAKACLLDARRLWRGEALLGVADEPFAAPFARALEAARADVDRQVAEVALALGEHHQLIPSLRLLVARNPDDEALTRLLMLALFRSGRQAEALDCYDTCRRALAEQGLLPTPLLTGAETAILTHAPEAMAPAPPPTRRPGLDLTGTVLAGRWTPSSPAPWAPGDAELVLEVEDRGGELVQAGESSFLARFGDVAQAVEGADAVREGLRRRGSPPGRFVVHDGAHPAARGAALVELCERLLVRTVPGQVLLARSGDVAEPPPPLLDLQDAGWHVDHAATAPVRVLQVTAPGQGGPAPAISIPPPRHNLPPPAGPLRGGDALVEEVAVGLAARRSVTIAGPGGIGKTRLAVEVARRLLGEHRGGAWLVELEWLRTPDRVADAVAAALGIARSRAVPAVDVLCRELAQRQVLVVLDTCEHLRDGVREVVERLVASCPEVSLLATSLEPLGSAGELVVRVPPLATVPPQPGGSAPAVELFFDHLGEPPAGEDDVRLAAGVVSLVDGVPLAVALAAARAGQLGLHGLAAELQGTMAGDTLRLLDDDGVLGCTLEWSFRHLGEQERRVLAALSVFAGPFLVDEATELLAGWGDPGVDVAVVLDGLVRSSAVVVEGDARRLLQPVRAFASAALEVSGDDAGRLRRRHAEVYRHRAEEADRAHGRAGEHAHLLALDRCAPNLDAAVEWALAAGDAPLAVGLTAALWRYWFSRGQLVEGLRRCRSAVALEDGPTPAGMRALGGSSYLAWWAGDFRYTVESARENARLAEAIDDGWGRAWAPLGIAAVAMFAPGLERPDLRPSIAWFVDADLPWEAGQALQLLGGQEWHAGNYKAACDHYGYALELNRAAGSRTFMDSLQAHGLMLALLGRVEDGVREIQAGLELADRRRDRVSACHALTYRAAVATYEGDHDEATRLYALALRSAADAGDLWIVLWALDGLATRAAHAQPAAAARLFGAVEALVEATGIRLAPREQAAHQAAVARASEALGKAVLDARLAEGRAAGVPDAIELALGLSG